MQLTESEIVIFDCCNCSVFNFCIDMSVNLHRRSVKTQYRKHNLLHICKIPDPVENRQNILLFQRDICSLSLQRTKKRKKNKKDTSKNYTIYDIESRGKFHRENITATEKQIFFIPRRVIRDIFIFLDVSDYKSISVYEASRWWFFLGKFAAFSSRKSTWKEERKTRNKQFDRIFLDE